jgi:hypothetical protein
MSAPTTRVTQVVLNSLRRELSSWAFLIVEESEQKKKHRHDPYILAGSHVMAHGPSTRF